MTALLVSISIASIGQTFNSVTRVKSFIKVWGFLKYYSPLIAEKNMDWDSVFLKNVQDIGDAKTIRQFNIKILGVINSAGKVPELKQQEIPDSLFLMNRPNTKWITTSTVFNNDVKKGLLFIYTNKNQGINRYIKIVHNTIDFSGEKKYDSIRFPELKYRLLFLSRFWNIINYFAPYKYLIGESWDNVLVRFIPKFLNVTDTVSYYKTWMELAKSLHDGHSQLTLYNQDTPINDLAYGKYTVPFYCQILNGMVVVRKISDDSICKKAGIKRGDIILKLDNEPIEKQTQLKRKYLSASNNLSEDHYLSRFVLDGQTRFIHLTVKRGDRVFTTAIERISSAENFKKNWRDIINYKSGNSVCKKLNDSILLIYAGEIWKGNIDTVKSLIKQSKAVIFDVRNYPNTNAFYSITDPFQSKPKTINYSTVALANFPGFFRWELNPNKIGHLSDSAFKGKVIILCDERTQSQGEYSCMVLQTIPNSITIGTQTAGADGNQTLIPIGGGLTISYSGFGIYYPDKTQTQRTGIKIDIHVRKTIAAIKNNKDEILDRALQYIKDGH